MSGNPYFGKTTKAFKEACESTHTEEHVTHMNELHHTDYVTPRHYKPKRTKTSRWSK